MSRYVPHPFLTISLVFMWLILTRFSLGHLILGTAIALVAGWVVSLIRPKTVELHHPMKMLKLTAIVAYDIAKSNIEVAKIILSRRDDPSRQPGFIQIKLKLRDRNALALLAVIISSTPGTAWIEHDPENGLLLMHILDLKAEEDWQKMIRERYETLLLEIFE